MKTLIPYFSVDGKGNYPDDYRKFTNMEPVSFQGVDYWLCDYFGSLTLEKGPATYAEYESAQSLITGIRKITVGAFYTRLDDKYVQLLALADTLAGNGDYSLKADLNRIDKLEYLDLDDPKLRPGLFATTVFTEEELDAVFVDGIAQEVPEALK